MGQLQQLPPDTLLCAAICMFENADESAAGV